MSEEISKPNHHLAGKIESPHLTGEHGNSDLMGLQRGWRT